MDAKTLAVRAFIYARFGRSGQAPSRTELAQELGVDPEWIDQRLAQLAEHRMVVLDDQGEIARALPFSARPTRHRVVTNSTTYYGNCAWDAFALASLLGPSATMDLRCGCCDEPIDSTDNVLSMAEHRAGTAPAKPLVHFTVPAARWWDDLTFT